MRPLLFFFDTANHVMVAIKRRLEAVAEDCQVAKKLLDRKDGDLTAHEFTDARLRDVERGADIGILPAALLEDGDQRVDKVRSQRQIRSFDRIARDRFKDVIVFKLCHRTIPNFKITEFCK